MTKYLMILTALFSYYTGRAQLGAYGDSLSVCLCQSKSLIWRLPCRLPLISLCLEEPNLT